MLCRVLCALLFIAWTAEGPKDTDVYLGLWKSPFQLLGPVITALPGVGLSAWQILLLALACASVVLPGGFRGRSWHMNAAIVASAASVAVTVLWGVVCGGGAYYAYYQVWRFLAALLMAATLLGAIRKSRDLKALGYTVVSAGMVRATLAIWFYWMHVNGKMVPPPPYMTTHDDSTLFAATIVIVMSWALERTRHSTWLAAFVVSVVVVYAMVLNDRRLVWIELLMAAGFGFFLMTPGRRRRVNRLLAVVVPMILLYVAVGWNREGAVFAPVRALATAGSDEDASSVARLEEIRNLIHTLSEAGNPLFGTGWGRPYLKFTSVYANFDSIWTLYLYTPHNSLLGVVVYAGFVGIFGIWLVVPVAAFLAAHGYRSGTRSVDRAAAMAALCLLPVYGAQCYGDIGFQSQTGSMILSVAMGVAGKVSVWAEAARQR